jgi:hypothetical protein
MVFSKGSSSALNQEKHTMAGANRVAIIKIQVPIWEP